MNQEVKLLTQDEIFSNPEKNIKWIYYNLLISIDNQVFNLSSQRQKRMEENNKVTKKK